MNSHCRITIADCDREREAIAAIRTRVFQIEQGVAPELEFDGRDATAEHLLAYWDGSPVGTARLRGLDAATIKFERLAVLPVARGRGIATQLMQAAIGRARAGNYCRAIAHAQTYVSQLYSKLGFVTVGDRFEEAGIPHIKMVLSLAEPPAGNLTAAPQTEPSYD